MSNLLQETGKAFTQAIHSLRLAQIDKKTSSLIIYKDEPSHANESTAHAARPGQIEPDLLIFIHIEHRAKVNTHEAGLLST